MLTEILFVIQSIHQQSSLQKIDIGSRFELHVQLKLVGSKQISFKNIYNCF